MANAELDFSGMSVDERLDLVHAIWNSIADSTTDMPLSELQRRELERRLADDNDDDPDQVVPWETVKADAQARFQKCRCHSLSAKRLAGNSTNRRIGTKSAR